MTYHRHNAALQQAGQGSSMAIGEFGGAPAVPGDNGILAVGAALLVLRDEPRGAQSVAGLGRRHAVVLQEPGQSAVLHHFRKIGRRRLRIVRALDAPLRPAGMAHLLDAGRRRARAGAYLDRMGAAVLQAHPFRARVRTPRRSARSRGFSSSRRCRAISPRCCAAPSRRFCPITTSTSPIGWTRAWCRCRKDASISTITSTT